MIEDIITSISTQKNKHWIIDKIKHQVEDKPYSIVDGPFGTQLHNDEYVDDGVPVIRIINLSYDGKFDSEKLVFITEEKYQTLKRSSVCPGDLIVAKTGATIGKVGVFEGYEKGIIASSCLKISLNEKIFPDFFKYYLISDYCQKQIILTSSGSTRDTINMEQIANLQLTLPQNIEEQKQIANYLDKKTSKIDITIAKNKELIDLLEEKRTALINQVVTKGLNPDVPMKDSGIEWIGEIPEHTEIIPFRRICNLNQGLQYPQEKRLSTKTENSFLYITVKYLNSKEKVEEYIPNPIKRVICSEEDVLLARTGATGEVFTNLKGVFHNNFFRINYDKKIYKDYLVYYLRMDSLKKILLLKAGVTTIPDLNHDSFLETPFILREFDEQKEIAKYLDKESEKINNATNKIKENIELLEEYKTSLIHHVVTGKIDVRGEEI